MHISIRKNRSKKKINYDLPVLVITRTNKNISANILVDKKTLKSFTTAKFKESSKEAKSFKLTEEITAFLKSESISKLVFDRNGYLYHGRIKSFVENIRKQNIEI